MDAEAFTSRTVEAGGFETHYLEAGNPDAPTVVLIHGGGAGADARCNWRGTIPALADTFHVVALDMLGFGDTAKPDPAGFEYTQAARNAHLAAFLETLAVGPAHLVGNSMGGATAIGVAVERPELVQRMVLMGSAGLNAELSPALMPIVQYDFTPEGMRKLIAALTADGFEVDEALVAYRHERSCEPATRAAYGATMGWIREQGGLFYDEAYIRQVRAPTLVVNGREDLVVPLANAFHFIELIDNAWGYVIPHCGHWAMVEASDDFVRATREFLIAS